MAATRPMAQQHNNKKYGNLAQECFTDGIVDQDMHLKMSKKIAQLTKVIYALNTKNDEHEQIVKSLQQQHEKEKLQLLEETKAKVNSLKSNLGAEAELRERISLLESHIEEHEKQKKKLLHDFDEFKDECANHETQLQSEHNHRISVVSKELLNYQKEFESKIKNFEALVQAFELEKTEAIADLKRIHQKEIDDILKTQMSKSSDNEQKLADELELLKTKHIAELQQATSNYDKLKIEKEQLELDYEEKFKKSKTLYENELELLRQSQNDQSAEKQKVLQDKIDRLTKDFQFQQAQFRHRIDGLVNDLSVSEDTINQLKSNLDILTTQKSDATEELANLRAQLEVVKKETVEAVNKHREVERELQVLRQRCNDQSDQLIKKSGVIGELTAAKTQKEAQIQKLTDELSDVSRNLKLLQDEKNLLLSKSTNDAHQKSLEVQALEQALEDVRIEKQAQKDKFEADIAGLERLLEEQKVTAENNLQEQLSSLHSRYTKELDTLKAEGQLRAKELEQKLKLQLEEETKRLETVNIQLKENLTEEITELKEKLQLAEHELENMQQRMGDTSSNLGAANTELAELKSQVSVLKQQLDKAKSELNASTSQITILKSETDRLKMVNSQMAKDHSAELKEKLENLNKSLEVSWLDKLKKEMAQFKVELENQFANDKASTVRLLNDQHKNEMRAVTNDMESKIRKLMMQISELEKSLEAERLSGDSKADAIIEKYDQQIQDLNSEIERITKDYERQLKNLAASIEEEWSLKYKTQESQLEASLSELKSKHLQDMTAQMTAHKATVDFIKKDAERQLSTERDTLQKNSMREKDELRAELESKHKLELNSHSQTSAKQITALRMELQRAVELKNQKDQDLLQVQEEHGERLSQRDRTIKSLESDIYKLEGKIHELQEEIQSKSSDIIKVKSEASKQLRQQEEFLVQEHAEEMERLQGLHAEETQKVLLEFTKAQTILKEKIDELSSLLEEAEDRYLNREPREEDLRMIEQLRRSLTQRDQEMQQLIADKQFYQMELVNRETNFTKVFAGGKSGPQQPQVGFINPLSKKKKGEKGPTKYTVSSGMSDGMVSGSSSAGSNARLRPIAGSPIHDERLNPNHVLPPPKAFPKKFVQ